MASDPRHNVLPGQRLRLAAEQVNGLNRLLRVNAGFGGSGIPSGPHAPYSWIYASSAAAVPRWGVKAITGMAVVPTNTDSDAETVQFQEVPIATIDNPTSSTTAFCVAIEPIAANGIGRVAVAGVVQVRDEDLESLAIKSVIWKGSDWSLVMLGDGGARFGEVSSAWNKGAVATVTRLYPDGSEYTPSQTFSALNQFATLAAPAEAGTRFVMCTLVETTWMLVAAEC
jgi:hypothetical protein